MTDTAEDLLFDLTLTDDQRMNRDTMVRFAGAEIRSLAKSVDTGESSAMDFYPKTAELGLTLLPIPEALGGAGVDRSPVSNALIFEDLAHGDLAIALGSVAPLGFVNTLIDQGTDAQREQFLPQFCTGEFVAATTALLEPRATFEPSEPATNATSNADGYSLSGTKAMVALGIDSTLTLVIAQLDGEGHGAFIVEGTPDGMTRTAEDNMGLRGAQLATIVFDNVQLPATALLGEGNFDLQRFIDLSRLGLCALAVGTCQAVLDYVIPYCNERVAFGEAITNRQSVAFMIADMAIELEAMRLMTWRAASLAERGEDFHEQAYLAKQFCSKHAMKIGTDGVQLLGGHGFCCEHPVELWYRCLRAIDTLEGLASV
ncbi:MAG: alkylation response protein AidB-like acyl-CoA dehydrogenase [Halioglobus sp.]|jgi:alkylation response protein AidB-like acyl-CoA dehydrogenase